MNGITIFDTIPATTETINLVMILKYSIIALFIILTLIIISTISESEIITNISTFLMAIIAVCFISDLCVNPPLKTVELDYDYYLAHIDESVSMEEVRKRYMIIDVNDNVYTLYELPQRNCEHNCEHNWISLGEYKGNNKNEYALLCTECEETKHVIVD